MQTELCCFGDASRGRPNFHVASFSFMTRLEARVACSSSSGSVHFANACAVEQPKGHAPVHLDGALLGCALIVAPPVTGGALATKLYDDDA